MGFWHTGYIEFHETSGIEEWCRPTPPIYQCGHCGEKFENAVALRQHRFQSHPFKRPLLFVRGVEVGSTPLTITQSIIPNQVETVACSTAIVNGIRMEVDQLAESLASIEHDIVRIELEGEGVTASFELRIEVASDEDMAGVEQVFFDVARQRRLDMRAIEQFIHGANGFKTAAAYYDGVCEYLYGVLVKERSSASSLPFETYREKFTRAADKLKTFDRPLANRVGGLIEFHFNHFPESRLLSPDSRVGQAAGKFAAWLSSTSLHEWSDEKNEAYEKLESLLTDWDTEQLIRWTIRSTSDLLGDVAELEKLLRSDPVEFDKTKLHILLAEIGLSSGDQKLVLMHARELRNSPSVAHWANLAIETCKDWSKN